MKTLIKNGIIYDGTLETPPYTGDLLIFNDRIQAVAPHINDVDAYVIDAGGRVISPGFIDTQIWPSFLTTLAPSNWPRG